MTIRTIRRTITFRRPFYLKGVDRLLPPGDYSVVTDEELIEGLSFSAYHRVSTVIFVPAPTGSGIEMVTIEPLDLEAALERDAASPPHGADQPPQDENSDQAKVARGTTRVVPGDSVDCGERAHRCTELAPTAKRLNCKELTQEKASR